MKRLKVMDGSGDSTVEFDETSPEQLARAQQVMDDCLARGGAVFKVDPKTNEGEKITRAEQVDSEALVVPAITAG